MPRSGPPYPQEFREQIVKLAKTGRTPGELSREFGCSAQTITNWIAQAAIVAGKPSPGKDGLSSAEREELTRLRREDRRLQMERNILAKRRRGVSRPIWIETGSGLTLALRCDSGR